MKIRRVYYSSRFKKAVKNFIPEFRDIIMEREKIFMENCFDTRLNTHKLSGKLKDYWSFSMTHHHRILFVFLEDGVVGFIDIGDHSIYQ